MSLRRLLAFFWIVLRPTRVFVGTALLIVAYGARVAFLEPARFNELFAIALLAQAFGASTGFVSHARRGYFDPVLVAGIRRLSVAAAHALVSVAPGFALLVPLACIDAMANGAHTVVRVGGPIFVASTYISAVAWMLGLPLRRFAAGVAWLLVMVIVLGAADVSMLRQQLSTQGGSWPELARASVNAAVFPVFLVAEAERVSTAVLTIVSALSLIASMAGVCAVCTLDVRLSE